MKTKEPELEVYGTRINTYCGNIVNGFRWRLTHGNGKIVAASSESFASRRNALRNARLTYKLLGDFYGNQQ